MTTIRPSGAEVSNLLALIHGSPLVTLVELIDHVEGWLTKSEGVTLGLLAQYGPGEGAIVEIGSFKGRSTIWLAAGSRAASREIVTAIDPHTGSAEHREGGAWESKLPVGGTYRVLEENLAAFKIREWVNPMVMTSDRAATLWEEPIRLLFIDGAHDVASVEQDLKTWERFVVRGGIIAFHDVHGINGGPDQVIDFHVRYNPGFAVRSHVDSLLVVEKVVDSVTFRGSMTETNELHP